jgi:hypothetical protein
LFDYKWLHYLDMIYIYVITEYKGEALDFPS